MPLSALRRRAFSLFACVLAASIAAASQAQQPPVPRDEDMPTGWFEGTIGNNRRVRMYVGTAGYPATEPLWGAYFYTTEWKLIPLEGTRLQSGIVRLFEGEPAASPDARAVFDLEITQDPAVSGTWTSADRARRLPVRLRRIAKPPSYAEALKNPRTFADPRWPFTFKYPAAWSLEVTGTTLLLQSADPYDMLFDNTLECERGNGVPPPRRAGDPPVEFMDSFYRAHDGWVVKADMLDECDDSGSRCTKPHTRSSDAGVIMDTHLGYRSHNPWGYAGLAEANEYLVVAGSEWVHCIDRALDSPTRIELRGPARKR